MNSIAVYCGSRTGHDENFLIHCERLAHLFAEQRITMVYGGGNVGLMGEMAHHILSSGGKVIGVIPERIEKMGVGHPGLTQMHVVKDMHERKALMAELSDGFISLPGGIGTMEEMFEIFSWRQLGYHHKPHGILNSMGYYDTLLKFLDEMVTKGFLAPVHRATLIEEKEPEKLLNRLASFPDDSSYT